MRSLLRLMIIAAIRGGKETMNRSNKQSTRVRFNAKLSAMLVAAILSFGSVLPLAAQQPAGVASPSSSPHGQTYPQWAGAWWKWFMELPLTNSAGDVHPGSACAPDAFDVTEGQTGNVWFLAAPFGPPCTRTATIPLGTSLFFQLLGAEWSSLEGPGPVCANVSDTSCQQANATFFANDITDLVAEIDGKRVHLLR